MASPPGPPTVRSYELFLRCGFDPLAFEGRVGIDLEGVDGPVEVNSVELTIRSVTANGGALPFEAVPEHQAIRVNPAVRGTVTLSLEFAGQASPTTLTGLYQSSFGSEKFLTTQTAPTGARRIFPCIDRPDRKAPIVLTVTVPADRDVIANAPALVETVDGPAKTIVFAPTPPMATYLFYLGVGHFESARGPAGRVQVAVFAPRGRGGSTEYGLQHAAAILPAFEQYFGIDYPLPKLDLIAVPHYAFGAMENWGAIVFRDMYLLIDASTPTRVRRYALGTIAHEIAHQWFGNLVTMTWWDDIWLNESFATFLEMRLLDRLYPTIGSLDEYLAYWMPLAFLGDALPSTHPVRTEVENPEQIAQIFDEISYGKGSAVLRMLEGYLGEERFRRGVSDFLDRYRYGNARSGDFWEALERSAGEPVRALLEEWTERPGFPLLIARLGERSLTLGQRRFALDGRHGLETWTIPITFELNGELRRIKVAAAENEVPLEGPVRSLHLNPAGLGFYRVLYDSRGYDLLAGRYATLAAVDQWTLLFDLGAFVRSGDVPFRQYTRFLSLLHAGTGYLPIREASETLLDFWLILGDRPELLDAALPFFRAQYERLGLARRPGEDDADGILRERIVSALVWMDPTTRRDLAAQTGSIDRFGADLRPPLLTAVAREGGRPEFDRLLTQLRSTPAEAVALDYELALVSFRDPSLVRAGLDLLRDGTMNRSHFALVLRRGAWNPEGRAVTWQWMTEHLPELAAIAQGTGTAAFAYDYALPYLGLDRADEVARWIRDHPIPEAERGARKGLTVLALHRAFRDRFR